MIKFQNCIEERTQFCRSHFTNSVSLKADGVWMEAANQFQIFHHSIVNAMQLTNFSFLNSEWITCPRWQISSLRHNEFPVDQKWKVCVKMWVLIRRALMQG